MNKYERQKKLNRINRERLGNSELLVQSYLRGGKSLEDLKAQYGISASRHTQLPNLVGLKYSQIDSPRGNGLVDECRGLILDEDDDWNIVAFPFRRFYNEGEGYAAELDWATSRCQEKVDGSLVIMWGYRGRVYVSTSGTADASGQVGSFSNKSFADLFWEVFADYSYDTDPSELVTFMGRPLTVMFELTTPYNRIVVAHKEQSLTLLAARFSDTGEEWSIQAFGDHFAALPKVREFPLGSLEEIIASLDDINPLEQEGYVVVDSAFRRIKVKSPQYVALHHAISSASLKSFVNVVRAGESMEILSSFPELQKELNRVQDTNTILVAKIESTWNEFKDFDTQKAYALAVMKYPYSAALFALRAGKVTSAKEYLSACQIDYAMKLLEL